MIKASDQAIGRSKIITDYILVNDIFKIKIFLNQI